MVLAAWRRPEAVRWRVIIQLETKYHRITENSSNQLCPCGPLLDVGADLEVKKNFSFLFFFPLEISQGSLMFFVCLFFSSRWTADSTCYSVMSQWPNEFSKERSYISLWLIYLCVSQAALLISGQCCHFHISVSDQFQLTQTHNVFALISMMNVQPIYCLLTTKYCVLFFEKSITLSSSELEALLCLGYLLGSMTVKSVFQTIKSTVPTKSLLAHILV